MNLSQYVLLSEKSFQTVLITTIKEEIFKFKFSNSIFGNGLH